MVAQDLQKKWRLDVWMKQISNVEDCISDIAGHKKVANDIDNILLRNYARIVICLKEILTLLDHGFPDGALSIARTVYEISILSAFLYKKYKEGDAQELIERYFVDQDVKAYKNLKLLHEGISKQPDASEHWKKKAQELEVKLQTIKKKYGSVDGEYWWASVSFDGKKPSFARIDQHINDDFMLRMLYKRACIAIHASAMGSFALLGRENENGNIIYTTQTDKGFEIPLLLGMISYERFVDILCDYWDLNKDCLMCNMEEMYQEYVKCCFSPEY